MCMTCLAIRPHDPACPYGGSGEIGQVQAPEPEQDEAALASSLPVYTTDQIADYLVSGFRGGLRLSFDAASGDTLLVDLTGLDGPGQFLARQALSAWSAVSGLLFSEFDPADATPTVVTEGPDAASGTFTAYELEVGQAFSGTLEGGPDRDAVAVTLAAGERIVARISGDDGSGLALGDPVLRLRDESGTVVMEVGGENGGTLAFEATGSGTYYLQAGSREDTGQGGYLIELASAPVAAEIVFDDDAAGAYATLSVSGDHIVASEVNVSTAWIGSSARTDSYGFQTYLHEIGHALGLGHAGSYNGSATWGVDNHYLNDSWQASVMSYFSQTENTHVDASFGYAVTPMSADIVAIQDLYGTAEARNGDDRYGLGAASGSYLDGVFSLSNPVAVTIYDTGGWDVFDFSDSGADQTLDLSAEAISSVLGGTGNLVLARGTVIEAAIGGTGADWIRGGAVNNSLDGGGGNDAAAGRGGSDTLAGGSGMDLLEGGIGADLVDGGDDGDLLFGDGVSRADLVAAFPDWVPPPEADGWIADGALDLLWQDILEDVFAVA